MKPFTASPQGREVAIAPPLPKHPGQRHPHDSSSPVRSQANRPKDQSRHGCHLKPLSLHDGQDHRIGYRAPVVEILWEVDFYATSRLTIQRNGSSTVHKGTIGRLQLISPAG